MVEREKVQIKLFESPYLLIRIHPAYRQRYGASERMFLRCIHQGLRLEVPTSFDVRIPVGILHMSTNAAEQLGIHVLDSSLPATLVEKELRIGPKIGVLCNPRWDVKRETLCKSTQLASLSKLANIAEEHGAMCYFFGIDDIDFTHQRMKAYRLEDGNWKKGWFPFPEVIYDQVISRKIERTLAFRNKREQLSQHYGEKIFNDGFFDKWQIHSWLIEDSKLKAHIPATVRHTSKETALKFLQSHPIVFLKPLHGSLGLGIIRFVKQADGSFTYDMKRGTGPLLQGKARSPADILKIFKQRLKNRPYIWQEGISLVTYKERPVDIRILMQRDHQGRWKRTKMFARVAKSGDFTSNLSSGGEALSLEAVLKENYRDESSRRRCKQHIAQVSRLVVEALEQQSGKKYGELGIDIGLDQQGRIWIIEVNSKPHKTLSTNKGRQDLVDLAFERPIYYAIYLATAL